MTASRRPTHPSEASGPSPAASATARPESAAEAIERLRGWSKDRLGLSLSGRQVDAFAWYLDELLRRNAQQNLTAVVDPLGIAVKHFLDSLTLVPLLGPSASGRMVDVGTGAGFPGLPVRILCSGLTVVLVEATGKKAEFCRLVAEGLGLKGVEVLHARAEEIGCDPHHRQTYDVATARAVASLPVLLEYLLPLVRVGGRVLAQKGENAPAEAHQAARALELLGGRLRQLHAVELPGVAELRYIIEVEKTAATPKAYPRRAGLPSKRPLLA
jgi:16S rRNA (guanine527-N7)-methyltransferase